MTAMIKPMKYAEYREKIDALGLTQVGAAQFLDIGERTSRRYALLAPIATVSVGGDWRKPRPSEANDRASARSKKHDSRA
jgi:hypothetical protein